MKYATFAILILAIVMIGFNITMIDVNNLFQGDSVIALIGIVAILCGVCIFLIYSMSKKINEKIK